MPVKHAIRTVLAISAALAMVACGQSGADSQTGEDTVQNDRPNGIADASVDGAIVDAGGQGSDDAARGTNPGAQAMILGAADAPVTLVEYASVTCPHCAAYHGFIFPILKEHYIEPGLVRFEFRDFPTAPPQLSYLGSSIARCAAAQNGLPAYFDMVGTLFEHQQDWVSQDYETHLSSYVEQADLTEPELLECINSDPVFEAINENVRKGMEEDGIQGTPAFVLAGDRLSGYNTATYEGYFEKIDAALTAAGATPPQGLPPLPDIAIPGHDHDH
ncbi:thioredoxin domain-containing protein [Aquisalinus flavus]|nr:thioredoxin domain-containing protein [Aquisalinus flavus]UNE46594.1 DsbA family protein [Aquisalinus flavus]